MFYSLSVKFRVLKLRFLASPRGPGGFREVRGAGRNHFHLSWYLIVPGITSYDKTNLGGRFFVTVHGRTASVGVGSTALADAHQLSKATNSKCSYER